MNDASEENASLSKPTGATLSNVSLEAEWGQLGELQPQVQGSHALSLTPSGPTPRIAYELRKLGMGDDGEECRVGPDRSRSPGDTRQPQGRLSGTSKKGSAVWARAQEANKPSNWAAPPAPRVLHKCKAGRQVPNGHKQGPTLEPLLPNI